MKDGIDRNGTMNMHSESSKSLYCETVSSGKTELLFVLLMGLFAIFSIWRITHIGYDAFTRVFIAFAVVFCFYSLNFRKMHISINEKAIRLRFGIFLWCVPFSNTADFQLDEPPALQKYGGAGIHFLVVKGRYRVSFNFLEHPRVVIQLKQAAGLVKDVSFTTCNPKDIIQILRTQTKE